MAGEMKGYKDKQTIENEVSKPAKKKEKYYEEHIKGGLLTQPYLFKQDGLISTEGEQVVIFEKAIMRGKCIMDCLVADSEGTVIGLEIKTEHDSTQRLKKQLHMYSLVCKYVYVVCHDDFVEKVETILKRHKYDYVGIISYIDFKGSPTFGKYKEAKVSPIRSAYHSLDILWKNELIVMYNKLRNPKTVNSNAYTLSHEMARDYKAASVNNKLTKPQVITNMTNILGYEGSYRWFSRAMVYGIKNSEKILDRYMFNYIKRGEDSNE